MSPLIFTIFLVLLAAICSFIHLCRATTHRKKKNHTLPPGPPTLPIIGNLHMLCILPHWSLYDLAKKYGPIMSMYLGNVPTIIVSSPQAAELFLKTHDTIFASRPKIQASLYLSYGSKGMALAEYGSYWCNVRKLCTLELLCAVKIESFANMRRKEMELLVWWLREAVERREVVNVREKVETLVEEMSYKMVFGRSKDERFDLKVVVQEAMALGGAS